LHGVGAVANRIGTRRSATAQSAANYIPSRRFRGIGTGVNGFNYPYVATLILNYKHDKWAVRRRSSSNRNATGARNDAGRGSARRLQRARRLGSRRPRYRYGAAGGSRTTRRRARTTQCDPNSYTASSTHRSFGSRPVSGHLRIDISVNKLTVDLTLAN